MPDSDSDVRKWVHSMSASSRVRWSEVGTMVLCAISAVIGMFCIRDALELSEFFSSELAVPGLALEGLAGTGIVLLLRARRHEGRESLSMWTLLGIFTAFVAVISLLLYVLFFGFGASA